MDARVHHCAFREIVSHKKDFCSKRPCPTKQIPFTFSKKFGDYLKQREEAMNDFVAVTESYLFISKSLQIPDFGFKCKTKTTPYPCFWRTFKAF